MFCKPDRIADNSSPVADCSSCPDKERRDKQRVHLYLMSH